MKENPEKLTRREEELMRCFWEHGPLFVRELVALSPDPKPHFNTLSTMVRALEAKGYVAHNSFGSTYQYYPVVSEEEFSRSTLGSVISRYFENSYLGAVGAGRGGEDLARRTAQPDRPHRKSKPIAPCTT